MLARIKSEINRLENEEKKYKDLIKQKQYEARQATKRKLNIQKEIIKTNAEITKKEIEFGNINAELNRLRGIPTARKDLSNAQHTANVIKQLADLKSRLDKLKSEIIEIERLSDTAKFAASEYSNKETRLIVEIARKKNELQQQEKHENHCYKVNFSRYKY